MPQPTSPPRLLLIEDNRDTLITAGRLLETCGFEVEIGRCGEDGLEKAMRTAPDVIVTDVVMPHTSGCDICDSLHQSAATASIPVIVYTGLVDAKTLARLSACGVRVFAIKPCLPSVIGAEARALLAGKTDAGLRVVTGDGEVVEDLARAIEAESYSHP